MNTLTREQLENRLAALHLASLELVRDTSLESLLEQIAMLAREEVNARYVAVGVVGENGELEKFIPLGITKEEIAAMAHPPIGLGLIGELMRIGHPIRIPRISDHPKSVGFPLNHPPMNSFLGVPIRQGDIQYGQIYLTEKIGADEFTREDEQVIETLASYAAIAIANVRLYQQINPAREGADPSQRKPGLAQRPGFDPGHFFGRRADSG